MTIYDRARDALNNATPAPWGHYCPDHGKPNPVFGATPGDEVATVKRREDHALIAAAPELASEVVRLHEQFAALADAVDQEAEAKSATGNFLMGEYHGSFAARIRAALEGMEE